MVECHLGPLILSCLVDWNVEMVCAYIFAATITAGIFAETPFGVLPSSDALSNIEVIENARIYPVRKPPDKLSSQISLSKVSFWKSIHAATSFSIESVGIETVETKLNTNNIKCNNHHRRKAIESSSNSVDWISRSNNLASGISILHRNTSSVDLSRIIHHLSTYCLGLYHLMVLFWYHLRSNCIPAISPCAWSRADFVAESWHNVMVFLRHIECNCYESCCCEVVKILLSVKIQAPDKSLVLMDK